jgi:hypothetical protein
MASKSDPRRIIPDVMSEIIEPTVHIWCDQCRDKIQTGETVFRSYIFGFQDWCTMCFKIIETLHGKTGYIRPGSFKERHTIEVIMEVYDYKTKEDMLLGILFDFDRLRIIRNLTT